jgi:cytochrome oxidase Cu insertion factor (SCO1/SenC/PrrC family)
LLGAFVPDGGGPSAAKASTTTQPVAAKALTGATAFMGISALGEKPAPVFRLADQEGVDVSLAKFRGKAVVLAFLDDLCGPLCPVLAEELRGAYADLGTSARRVAFVGVNVDLRERAPADLLSYSSTYGLLSIRPWFFLTGSHAQLSAVWRAYGVSVEPGPEGTMAYTSALYFITPGGDEAYEATPYANAAANGSGTLPASDIKAWAAGIAGFAEALLSPRPGR